MSWEILARRVLTNATQGDWRFATIRLPEQCAFEGMNRNYTKMSNNPFNFKALFDAGLFGGYCLAGLILLQSTHGKDGSNY